MLILRLWNYIRGYVIILVEGFFPEKFINICTHRQILLWDIRRRGGYGMILKMSIKGFRLLRPVARKTRCRVRILGKKGLPFIMHRYRRRKAFLTGAVLFILLFYFLTSFIWAVEIKGNKTLDTAYLEDKLALCGVKPGVLKFGINTDRVAGNMMLEVEELAWIGVAVRGTKVKVEVAERKKPPELVPLDKPCNIIARRDGVLRLVVAKAGQEMAKAGDTVLKGQVIISGMVKSQSDEKKIRMVHASGIIKARTWYEGNCPVETRITRNLRTGRVANRYSLLVFNRRIPLFPSKVDFEEYETVEIRKNLSLGEDLMLPFGLETERYYENEAVANEIDMDEAKRRAAESAWEDATEGLDPGAQIIKADRKFLQKENGALEANVIIECLEDIGEEMEIGGK